MNQRHRDFQKGLSSIRSSRKSAPSGSICAIRPTLYNSRRMPNTNQIIQGDSIELLNQGPEGWIGLVFADPPFNIGYLYHGYNDKRDDKEYLKFSKDWMAAVHRALKP